SSSGSPASESFGPSSSAVLRPSRPCFSLFLSVAKPRSPRQFFPHRWNSLLSACVPRCSLCLPRLPWRSPRLVFPLPLFVSLLSSVANQSLRESFSPACVPQERESEV